MSPVHPDRVLKRELAARGLSANRLALALRLPSGRIADIVNGKRGISPETALRLAAISATARASGSTFRPRTNSLAEREIGARVVSEVKPDAA